MIPFMLAMSLLLSMGFLMAFLWATKKSQFDDLVTPSWRAVFDEPESVKKNEEGENNNATKV